MESFKTRQEMRVVDTAREGGSIVGYSDNTICTLRKQFFDNQGELEERKQGKYERVIVYYDEEVNKKGAVCESKCLCKRKAKYDCPIFLCVGTQSTSSVFSFGMTFSKESVLPHGCFSGFITFGLSLSAIERVSTLPLS